ncbi:unnamed protein product [Brachionus calyciflorus]|uniref:Serine hydrolase domain-containing protein n=1 Tax=Brachionus calyciflorus TaxID=104777 RepID=A0A813NPI8_9BILA|nr:unnamed protein product [Brachionus calyciflorus]
MSKRGSKPEEVVKKPLKKILMIHGYRQTEKSFREKTGGLRKSLKNQADFIFCEAPHIVLKREDEFGEDSNQENIDEKGWWFSSENKSYNAQLETNCDLGFEESLQYLDNVFQTQGPFDGILAFSQGACLGSVLCKISKLNQTDEINKFKNIKFNFAILVAGFKSGQTQHDFYYEQKIDFPTLHIIGETDKVIPKDMSEKLLNYFVEPKVFVHTGGHFVPVNADAKNSIINFLNSIN